VAGLCRRMAEIPHASAFVLNTIFTQSEKKCIARMNEVAGN